MPLLVFVYFTQFLDKNILSYASIMNFPVTGIWYNDVAQAFYMGYLIFMFPTQARLSPSLRQTITEQNDMLILEVTVHRSKIPHC